MNERLILQVLKPQNIIWICGQIMQQLHQAIRYHLDLWASHAIPTSKRKNWLVCGQLVQYSNSTQKLCIHMKKKNKEMNMTLWFEA